MNSIPISKSTWKPNSRNCSGQTSSYYQFPFSGTPPSILERWMEETFRHGFSCKYRRQTQKQKLVLSFTTETPEALYSHKGAMGYTIDNF